MRRKHVSTIALCIGLAFLAGSVICHTGNPSLSDRQMAAVFGGYCSCLELVAQTCDPAGTAACWEYSEGSCIPSSSSSSCRQAQKACAYTEDPPSSPFCEDDPIPCSGTYTTADCVPDYGEAEFPDPGTPVLNCKSDEDTNQSHDCPGDKPWCTQTC